MGSSPVKARAGSWYMYVGSQSKDTSYNFNQTNITTRCQTGRYVAAPRSAFEMSPYVPKEMGGRIGFLIKHTQLTAA